MTSPAPSASPINLADFLKPLPPVILPDGSTHQLVWTAQAAEQFKRIRLLRDALATGEASPQLNAESEAAIDACLAAVLPSASAEQLLSFGLRYDVKMSVLIAASGNADRALELLIARSGKATAGEASPPSPPATTSAE